MQKINLIYFWRFESEKGFDLLVDSLICFHKKYWELTFNINLFGDWTLKSYLLDNPILKPYLWKNIFYHGRVWRDIIEKSLKNSHFAVVPSRFLETFGLVALESLSLWVPVIWFKKWWLISFVFDNLDISCQTWVNDAEKLANLIEWLTNIDNNSWKILSEKSVEISKMYELDSWIKQFDKLTDWSKKILMVSDYLPVIWWIENYIKSLKTILPKYWYDIELFWHSWFGGKIPRWFRLLWLPFTWCNLYWAIKFIYKIWKYKPDIIWFHSINRFFGWIMPFVASFSKSKKFIMYHDFGYFHPYPSIVNEQSQLDYKLWLRNFMLAAWNVWIFWKISVFLKYLSSISIQSVVKNSVDYHLVPSEFMISVLENNFSIDSNKIKVLPHFINKW